MHLLPRSWMVLLIAYLLLVASTCEEKTNLGIAPTDLTKNEREQLGDLLHKTILQSPNDFPTLNRATKGDSVIQLYLQTLYDQVTRRIRLDRSTPETSRWTKDRQWTVTVIDDPNRYAFSLPGGYFYISSGFLKTINKGYEIYYLMAFEATNVNDRFLLENLASKYTPNTLLELIEQPEQFSPAVLEEITRYLKKSIAYEATIVQEIDEATAELICDSSIFDRFGIISLLEMLNQREQWRDTRPSYTNRLNYLNSLPINDCGTIKATGAYQRMVLENL